MSSSVFEIVELPNGEIALQRAGDDGEPLVSIRFSSDSLYFLKSARFEVARAMIEAGLEVAGELAEYEDSLNETDLTSDSQILH